MKNFFKSCTILLKSFLFVLFYLPTFTYSQNKYFNELTIGKGGGFTNLISGYVIDSLGNVFQCHGRIDCQKDSLIKTIDKKNMKKLQKYITRNSLTKISVFEPGNIYNFIQIVLADKTFKIVWNPYNKTTINKKLNQIFSKIESFVK